MIDLDAPAIFIPVAKFFVNALFCGNTKPTTTGTAFEIKNFEKIIRFTKDNNIPDEKVYFVKK